MTWARRTRLAAAALGVVGLALIVWLLRVDLLGMARSFVVARPSPERYPVRGIDVSHHQGRVDWRRVAESGVRFAFVKATEGADFRDRHFRDNWTRAQAAGILVGAYHFFTFCSPGERQARHFLSVVPAPAGALPPAVDVEFAGNCRAWRSESGIRRELSIFVREVEAVVGRAAIVYTTSDALERVVPEQLHDRPFWLRALFSEPRAPVGRFAFWQYSDAGTVPGIDGPVDLDVFRGGEDEFSRWVRSRSVGLAESP